MMSFYSGGYFIVKPSVIDPFWDTRLLPDRIVTVSTCICDTFPDLNEKDSYYKSNSINLEKMNHWIEKNLGTKLGWDNVFFDLESAQSFYDEFLSHLPELKIIGIGLTHKYTIEFLENEEYYPGPEVGIYKALSKLSFLDPHGVLLGYDVLGTELDGTLHTYVCNYMVSELANIGVKWNEHGLISSFDDACRAAEYLSQMELEADNNYYPWIVLEYEKSIE